MSQKTEKSDICFLRNALYSRPGPDLCRGPGPFVLQDLATFPGPAPPGIRLFSDQMESKTRFANILFDETFKIVMGAPGNDPLLIKIIELLLPGKQIRTLQRLDKENHGFVFSDKNTTFDLFCTSEAGEQFHPGPDGCQNPCRGAGSGASEMQNGLRAPSGLCAEHPELPAPA